MTAAALGHTRDHPPGLGPSRIVSDETSHPATNVRRSDLGASLGRFRPSTRSRGTRSSGSRWTCIVTDDSRGAVTGGAAGRASGGQRWPVWPKPPPRSSPSSESTTCQATSSTRWTTSWARRSPRLTRNGSLRVGVEQDQLDLAAVGRVDQARGVGHRQAMVQGVATTRQDEAGIAERDGDRDARRHQQPAAAGRHDAVLPGSQIEPGVAGVGVRRQRQVGVEADDRHGEHNAATLPHPGATRWLRSAAMATPTRPPSVDCAGPGDGGRAGCRTRCASSSPGRRSPGPASVRRGRGHRRARRCSPILLGPVINATGVLLHTNLGRAPLGIDASADGA